MTDPHRDDTPAPPASTSLDPQPDEGDDELAPPFVPGGAEPSPESDAVKHDVAAPAEPPQGPPAPDGPPAPETGAEDDFPFEAFDIEGGEGQQETAEGGEPAREPTEATVVSAGGRTGATPADELADRLEAMADKLRRRGTAGVEADMSSPDRFTALLAGLLAGYLSGRE